METTATTANPRNGYPALSSKVPPTVLVACTIPVAWLEVPPLRSGLSTTHCAGGQVPPTVLVAMRYSSTWPLDERRYHPLCWWPSTTRCAGGLRYHPLCWWPSTIRCADGLRYHPLCWWPSTIPPHGVAASVWQGTTSWRGGLLASRGSACMAGAGLARLAAVSVLGGAVVPVSLGRWRWRYHPLCWWL